MICLAEDTPPELKQLQRHIEAAGAQFHSLGHAQDIVNIAESADDLIIFADGVLFDETAGAAAKAILNTSSGVLSISANEGVAVGFERIDADHAWAGIMRIPGAAAVKLADLPSDSDPASALLRIALQSGVPILPIPDALLLDGSLARFESQAQVEHGQDIWFRRHFVPRSWAAPGLAAIDRIIGRLGGQSLARPISAIAGISAVLAICIAAFAASWLMNAVVAFVLLACAAALSEWLVRIGTLVSSEKMRTGVVYQTIVDVSIIAAAGTAAFARDMAALPFAALFAASCLIAALRIVTLASSAKWVLICSDRILLCIGLAIAAAFDIILPTMQVLALLALAAALFIGSFRHQPNA